MYWSFVKQNSTNFFKRKVIKYFEENKLINADFARNLLSWENSGFSIDNSVRIFGSAGKARESLAQYIARCPISLEKIKHEPSHAKVLFKTPNYNDYFKKNFHVFDAFEFIALVTAYNISEAQTIDSLLWTRVQSKGIFIYEAGANGRSKNILLNLDRMVGKKRRVREYIKEGWSSKKRAYTTGVSKSLIKL